MTSQTLERVAGHLPLDVDAIRERVDEVMDDDLYWFPVRHHSATAAKLLEATILKRKPKVIFIEAPFETEGLVPYVVDGKTQPPVAIYSSYRDDDNVLGLAGIASPSVDIPPRFSCWYPLVEYSPEYVAMRAGVKAGAEIVFIDLPHYAQIRPASAGDGPEAPETEEPDAVNNPVEHHATSPMRDSESEQLIVGSNFYQQLAKVAGYKSWDEGWDSLFEFGPLVNDPEAFRREMATFCAASRATCPPERIEHDGTLERERCMWQTIQRRLSTGDYAPSEAMVVCGGFHLFLDPNDTTPPPEAPPGTVNTTVVPYSYFRMSELSGYAAGNRAPQFYSMYWQSLRGKLDDLSSEYIVRVLKQARKRGEALSSADAISVTQHARMLGALRGRAVPVLDDLRDALLTCCCKGDPKEEGIHLFRAMDEVDIGTKIGRVTPKQGRLPIVDDFYHLMDEFDLTDVLIREKRIRVDLDKREAFDARRSAFLHRLEFLEIPLCQLTEAPAEDFATGLIFQEKWGLRWNPEIEPKLVEFSLYGDTIESAVMSRLREIIVGDEPHAGRTCSRLVKAIDMDLPDLVREVEQSCSEAIDSDSRFLSLCEALGALTIIDRHAVYRELRRDQLADLIIRCFNRTCFSIVDIIAVPEDQQASVIDGLLHLAEIVLRGKTEGIDRQLFSEHVSNAAAETEIPYLRGAFLGLLSELRVITTTELESEIVGLANSPQDRLATAGELLHGLLTTSRTSILLGASSLVSAIDELLEQAEWETFLLMLPRMRAAFEQLHDRQRESFASTVAEHYGLKEGTTLTELQTSAAAAARIAEIDHRVADIMTKWEF
ncbi:MAG: hypothetical protein KDA52_06860 [Planctomycetaceae bacterium]|nr:hypothetical protein [Planctomycetaceae bacterium]